MLRRALIAMLLVLGSVGGVLSQAAPASAAGPWYVATNGNNAFNCTSAATPCATVAGALAKPGFVNGDTINVATGNYGALGITKPANIVGTGGGFVATGTAAIFAAGVNVAGTVTISNATFTGGNYSVGGGLYVQAGNVVLNNVVIANNKAALGGGVFVQAGSLAMHGGRISGNTATAINASSGWGGGAFVSAGTSLALDGVLVSNNKADGNGLAFGYGGGVLNGGALTVDGGGFSGNIATAPGNASVGGGIMNNGTSTTVTDVVFSDNSAAVGGGIGNLKPVTVGASSFIDNTALAGGAISTSANVTLTGSDLVDNTATGNYGGGVYATGTPAAPVAVVLDGVDARRNAAVNAGGALYASANVTTTIRNGSLVADGTAQLGAGVFSAGALTVRDSAITGNDASFQGGGLLVGSSVATDTPLTNVFDSEISGNTAALAGGGVVALNRAAFLVDGGVIAGNSAPGGGGIVIAGGATADVVDTDITGNTATSLGGGGVFNSGRTTIRSSTVDGNGAATSTGFGGGIYSGTNDANVTTTLDVRASTISHNLAEAGSAVIAYSPGSGASNTTTIDDSTVTGNTSRSAFGAIEAAGRPMTITDSTITGNTAAAGGAGALVVLAPVSGGVSNTVFAGNGPAACAGPVVNNGGNHAGPGQTGCGTTPGADPQLGALADNGGPTLTQLPGPASPLLDVRTCSGSNLDQRGVARPQGAKCDTGAVEAQQILPTVAGPAHVDLTVGSSADPAATFTSTGSPQPDLSASELPEGLTFTDDGDGTGTISGTPAAGTGGVHTVTVTATNEKGDDSVEVEIEIAEAPELSGPTSSTYVVGTPGGPDVFEQVGGHPVATLSTDSDLPGGVTFADNADGTGTLGGTAQPTTGGLYDVTIDGTNGVAPDATWPFALTVNEAPSLDAPATATFAVGTAGSAGVTVGGFPQPTVSATGLPAGLAVDGTAIVGAPEPGTGGVHTVGLTATNGVGDDATDSMEITVQEGPSIAGPQSVRLVEDEATTIEYAAGGYPAPTLVVSGELPAGVTFTDNGDGTATLGGAPDTDTAGTYPVTIKAANGIGSPASIDVSLEVVSPVAITTTALPAATLGVAYDIPVLAEGGEAPYAYLLKSGSLPAGLNLTADGRITGTPSGSPGTSTFTVEVVDSGTPAHRDTQKLSIKVEKGTPMLVAGPVVVVGNVLLGGELTATLMGGPGMPIAGATITFRATNALLGNPLVCTATTDANGVARCRPNLAGVTQILLAPSMIVSYAGSSEWQPVTVVAPKKLGPPAPWT